MEVVVIVWSFVTTCLSVYAFLDARAARGAVRAQRATIDKLVAVVGGGDSPRQLNPAAVEPVVFIPSGFEWNAFCDTVKSCARDQRYKAFREGRQYWVERNLAEVQFLIEMMDQDDRDNALAYFSKHRVVR